MCVVGAMWSASWEDCSSALTSIFYRWLWNPGRDPGDPVWIHSTDPQTLVCPAPSTPAPAPEQPLGGSVSLDTWQGSTPDVGAAERDAPWGPVQQLGPNCSAHGDLWGQESQQGHSLSIGSHAQTHLHRGVLGHKCT